MPEELKDLLKRSSQDDNSVKELLKRNPENIAPQETQLGQYGVGKSKYDTEVFPSNVDQLGEIRGQRQPSLSKIGSGLVNAVSGTALDAIAGTSYLLDFEQHANLINGTETEFTNGVADWADKVKKDLNLPVYRTKASEGFSPTSAGWWGDNLPSIASTLSLVIPAEGATLALGKFGKLMRAEKLLKEIGAGKAELGAIKDMSRAILSRYAESTMEATDSMNQLELDLKDAINPKTREKYTEEEINTAKGNVGRETFYKNLPLATMDLLEYRLAFKGWKGAKEMKASKILEDATKLSTLKTMASEAGEEVGQYIISKEAQDKQLVEMGLKNPSDFSTRLKGYIKDGDFWSSAFLGALGGGVFSAAGNIITNIENKAKDRQQTIDQNLIKTNDTILKGDKDSFHKISDESFINAVSSSYQNGSLESFKDNIKKLRDISPSEIDNSDYSDNDFSTKVNQRLQDIDTFEETAWQVNNEIGLEDNLKPIKFSTMLDLKLSQRRLNKVSTETEGLYNQEINTIPLDILNFKKVDIQREALKSLLQEVIPSENAPLISKLNEVISNLDKTHSSLKETILTNNNLTNKELETQLISENNDILKMKEKNLFLDRYDVNGLKDFLSKLNDPKDRAKLTEELKTTKEEATKRDKERKTQDFIKKLSTISDDELSKIAEVEKDSDNKLHILNEVKKRQLSKGKEDRNLKNKIINFAYKLKKGIKLTQASDLEFYENNKEAIESSLKEFQKGDTTTADEYSEDTEVTDEETSKDRNPDAKVLSNIMGLAWKSIRNPEYTEEDKERNKVLSDFLENPANNLANQNITYSVDIEYLDKIFNKELTEKIKNKTVKSEDFEFEGDSLIGQLPIKVSFDNVKVEDKEVYGHLHDDTYEAIKDSETYGTVEEQRLVLRNLKLNILNEYIKGKTLSSSIDGKSNGYLNLSKEQDFPITSIFENTPTLLISNGDNLVKGFKNKATVMEPGLELTSGTKGNLYALTTTANGSKYPLKLNVKDLSTEEGVLIYNLFKNLITNKTINDLVEGINGVSNLTYKQALDFLVYQGTKTKGNSRELYFDSRVLHFGGNQATIEELESKKDDIVKWLTEYKKRNISIDSINKPLFNDLKVNDFTLFGKTYDRKSEKKYNDFLSENNIILTNAIKKDGILFYQPTVFISWETKETEASFVTPEYKEGEERSFEDMLGEAGINPDEITPTDLGDDIEPFSLYNSKDHKAEVIDITQAKENIKKVLGDIPIEIEDFLIKGFAQGQFYKGIIKLSKLASKGTEFHEAFHAIFRGFHTSEERKPLYSEAIKVYGNPSIEEIDKLKKFYPKASDEELTLLSLEERMADDFQDYMVRKDSRGLGQRILDFFKKLLYSIGIVKEQNTNDIQKLYSKIASGEFTNYNNIRASEVTTEANKRDPEFIQDQIQNVVDVATFVVIKENNILDMENIKDISLDKALTFFKQQLLKSKDDIVKAHRLTKVISRWNFFTEAIKENLNYYKIKFKDNDEFIEEDNKEGGLNIKSSYEYSGKDNASSNVKLLIAFLPEIETYDINGKPQYNVDSYLGYPKFTDFNSTWKVLEENLSGLHSSLNSETGVYTSAFDKMVNKLSELVLFKPELKLILDKLTSKDYPDFKKRQFFNAFSKQKINFLTSLGTEDNGNWNWKIFNSNNQSPVEKLRNDWEQQFIEKLVISEDEKVQTIDKNKKDVIVNAFSKIKGSVNTFSKENKKSDKINISLLSQFKDILLSIGIQISDKGLNYAIYKQDGSTNIIKFNNLVNKLQFVFNNLDKIEIDQEGSIKTSITDEKNVKELAEYESLFKKELTDATVIGPDGSPYWLYTQNNSLTKVTAEFKSDNAKLDALQSLPYHRNSLWIPYLKSIEGKEGLQIHIQNNLKSEDEADDLGDKSTNLTISDDLTDRINKILSGYYPLLTAADKPTQYFISGPQLEKSGITLKEGEISFTFPRIIDIISDYFIDEFNRTKLVWEQLYGENPIEESQMIEHYHYKWSNSQRQINRANGLKMWVFPEFSHGKDIARTLGLYESVEGKASRPKELTESDILSIKEIIKSNLTEGIKSEVDFAISSLIVSKDYSNTSIDNGILSKYEATNKDRKTVITEAIADYYINGLIANIEQTKILTSDPAMFKSMDDFKKRVPGLIAPGLDNAIFTKEEIPFTIAIIRDRIMPVDSKVYDQWISLLIESGKTHKEANEIIEPYRTVNQTDAQAYITLNRWKKIQIMQGKWKPSMESDYQKLLKGEEISSNTELNLQSLKGQYQETSPKISMGFAVPTYLKYSQAVLYPSLVKNSTELQRIYDMMIKNSIDEVVHESGIKTGIQDATDIYSEDGSMKDDFSLNPVTLSNEYWKMQQDLPTHGDKETLEGSQHQKNIFANIKLDEKYSSNRTGQEIVNEYNKIVTRLSNIERDNLLKEIGSSIDSEGNITSPDRKLLYNLIITSAKDRDTSDNLIEALDKGIALDAIPQYRSKIQNLLMSIIKRRTVDLQMPGGSFIQISGANFTKPSKYDALSKPEKDSIIWLTDKDTLLPPRIEDGEPVGGQCLLPYSIYKLIPEKFKKDINTLNKYLIDSDLLDVVGYRIPNQGFASIDALQVAGFMPEISGDSIVLYNEITKKAGSDFDIDKMYIIRPNYKLNKEDKLKKISSNLDTKESLQNKKLEIYQDILANKYTFSQTITPLDSQWLKDDATHIDKLKGKENEIKSNLTFFSPKYQLETKKTFTAGKFGVGQASNHMVDIPLSQLAKNSININLGIGQKTPEGTASLYNVYDVKGNFINKNLEAYQNGYVDIAKDPYITSLNNNTFTANSVFTLIRTGADRKWISSFFTQPIIEEYTALTFNYEGRTSIKETWKSGPKLGRGKTPLEIIFEKYNDISVDATIEDIQPANLSNYSIKELEEGIKGKLSNKEQLELLQAFLEIQKISKSVNNMVASSKADTNGGGKSLLDAQIYDIKKNLTETDPLLNNVQNRFDNTALEAYYKNSVLLSQDLYSNLFIQNNHAFKSQINELLIRSKKFPMVNSEIANTIINEIYSYIYTGSPIASKSTEELKDLFFGNNSISQRLFRAKFHPESPLKDNLLIQHLEIKISKTTKIPSMIGLNNLRLKDKYGADRLTNAWRELLTNENPKTVQFAKDLITIAYYQSGFKGGSKTFFDLIPNEALMDSNFNEYIESKVKNLNQGELESLNDQFFRNNWKNTKFVPKVSKKTGQLLENKGDKTVALKINEKSEGYIIGETESGLPIFYPYITKVNEYATIEGSTYERQDLYKFQGIKNNKGLWEAIYTKTYKLGYNRSGYRISEYYYDTKTKGSFIPQNNYRTYYDFKDKIDILAKDLIPYHESNDERETYYENEMNITKESEDIQKKDFMDKINSLEISVADKELLVEELNLAKTDEDFGKLLKKLCK